MARKYARDNRGRFASVGATARGGRLRTASGGKRATVTMKAQGPGGRIGKPRGLKPNPSRPKGGELAPRSTAMAPANRQPAATKQRNTFNVARRRAEYVRKDNYNTYDEAVKATTIGNTDNLKLIKAQKDLTKAALNLKGQRVSIRSKKAAAAAQRQASQKSLKLGKVTMRGRSRNPRETVPRAFNKIKIGTSLQGNLLTGRQTRIRSGMPRMR